MPEIIKTSIYAQNKNTFLKQCNWRSFVESAISRLERKIGHAPILPGTKWGMLTEITHEECSLYARVGCVYVINPKNGDTAPCWLFFPGEYNGIPLPTYEIGRQMALVLDELGWE